MKNKDQVVEIIIVGPCNTGKLAIANAFSKYLKNYGIETVNEGQMQRFIMDVKNDEILKKIAENDISVKFRVFDEFNHI